MFLSRMVIMGVFCVLTATATVSAATNVAIHPGDELQVVVYDHHELSGAFTVDDAGTVSMPLAGTVRVGGLQPGQIAQRIEVALKPYVLEPAVDVQLKSQFNAIFVSGGPGGVLKLQPGETLVTAVNQIVARATSVTDPTTAAPITDDTLGDAKTTAAASSSPIDTGNVRLMRDGVAVGVFDVPLLSGKGESGPVLQPGDTLVLVDKPLAVRVWGDVRMPGVAHLRSDEPLSDAIAQRGGLLPSAAVSHITLQRAGSTASIALGSPDFSQPAANGDTLTIPYAPHVAVTGRVARPGVVALKTNFTLLNALYEAGGPADYANLKSVQVVTMSGTHSYDVSRLVYGDTSQNPVLKDGDVVLVPEGHKINAQSVFQSIIAAVATIVLVAK